MSNLPRTLRADDSYALATDCSDQPLGKTVLPRRAERSRPTDPVVGGLCHYLERLDGDQRVSSSESRALITVTPLADPEYTYGAKNVEPVRTILAVPILKGEDLLGVIVIYRFEVRPFTDKQIALVETFADQSAIAIENVRLFEEVQQRTEALAESLQQQRATADVLKVISRSAFDLPTVLQTVVESAARLCEADKANIIRQKNGGLYVTEAYGFSQEFIEAVKDMPIEPTSGVSAESFIFPMSTPSSRQPAPAITITVVSKAGRS